MNKRFLLAWLAVFVVWFAGSFVVHGVLLHDDYMALVGKVFRAPAEEREFFPLMILAHLVMSGALVWIYARGVEARPWAGQGIRYGIAIALLTTVPLYLISYVVQPIPGATVAKQIVFETILDLLLGLTVAAMVRRAPA